MIRLVVTTDDKLYDRLVCSAQVEGDTARRSTDVLDGFKQAMTQTADVIIVDMSLHAADTLLEALHSRKETASIPLFAVTTDEAQQLPLQLRRLCVAVLEVDKL